MSPGCSFLNGFDLSDLSALLNLSQQITEVSESKQITSELGLSNLCYRFSHLSGVRSHIYLSRPNIYLGGCISNL